jgi:hypothetical protein
MLKRLDPKISPASDHLRRTLDGLASPAGSSVQTLVDEILTILTILAAIREDRE